MAVLNEKLLKNDIQKYLYTFAKAYCKEAQQEITKMAKYAIEQFYKDYSPRYYVRTHNLLKKSHIPYYHDNGKRIYGGVRITSELMRENYDGVDAYYVADAGWHGWHGTKGFDFSDNWKSMPSRIKPIYTTPPLEMVERMMSEEKFLNELQEKAAKVANEQKYKYMFDIMK